MIICKRSRTVRTPTMPAKDLRKRDGPSLHAQPVTTAAAQHAVQDHAQGLYPTSGPMVVFPKKAMSSRRCPKTVKRVSADPSSAIVITCSPTSDPLDVSSPERSCRAHHRNPGDPCETGQQ